MAVLGFNSRSVVIAAACGSQEEAGGKSGEGRPLEGLLVRVVAWTRVEVVVQRERVDLVMDGCAGAEGGAG